MEKDPIDKLWDLINTVDATFNKDDIKNVPRGTLEDTVTMLYDGIREVILEFPDWWERK